MPILIDGNNLMHTLPPASRSRTAVRQLTLERIRHERMRVYLVFDGPAPEGFSQREELGHLTILYSGKKSADDLIVQKLPRGPSASNWTVITNDRGLSRRVKTSGAKIRKLNEWTIKKAPKRHSRPLPEAKLSSHDIDDWQTFFAQGKETDDDQS